MVLDAAGLDALAADLPPAGIRSLLEECLRLRRAVLLPALVCAEVCRSRARTRSVEALLLRHSGNSPKHARITVVNTDFRLARQVGALLGGAGRDSSSVVDAHVVALCVPFGGGLVVTSDPGDINAIAQAAPTVRVVTRSVDGPDVEPHEKDAR